MIDNSKGKIIMGGTMDETERFIEPTVVLVDDVQDSLIVEESFGPLIPILPVNDLDEAIRIAREVHSTPLGLYPFGNRKETDRILSELRSGGASVNDAYFHASIPTLAFGGVGDSGQGAYRGKASFDCFTHRRSVTTTPSWVESLISVRYPPYKGKLAKFQKMSALTPNFDRDGKVKFSLLNYILTFGAGSARGAATRFLAVVLGELFRWNGFEGCGRLTDVQLQLPINSTWTAGRDCEGMWLFGWFRCKLMGEAVFEHLN